jgi:metal-responsive CopG/Arc/MetJ family transcriptional regulator
MKSTVRTTLSLPADLLEAADQAVREGAAQSRNEFVALALRHELAAQERKQIDAAFASMAEDTDYLEETAAITEHFAAADWEAFNLGEGSNKL